MISITLTCFMLFITTTLGVTTIVIQPPSVMHAKKVKCDIILKQAVSFYKHMSNKDKFSYNDIKNFYDMISLPDNNYMHQLENRPNASICLSNLLTPRNR